MSAQAKTKTNAMSAGLRTGTRAPDEALRALAQLSGDAGPSQPAPQAAASQPEPAEAVEAEVEDPDFNQAPARKPVRRETKAAASTSSRPLIAESPLSFQVTMNPKELRKQLGVRVLQSIQMRLKRASIVGQLSGEGPQTAQEIVEAALTEYLDKLGY